MIWGCEHPDVLIVSWLPQFFGPIWIIHDSVIIDLVFFYPNLCFMAAERLFSFSFLAKKNVFEYEFFSRLSYNHHLYFTPLAKLISVRVVDGFGTWIETLAGSLALPLQIEKHLDTYKHVVSNFSNGSMCFDLKLLLRLKCSLCFFSLALISSHILSSLL